MDSLMRFGAGNQLYEFVTANQISLRDNFRNVVPRTTRLPGLSGGFDEYGRLPAPNEIGNVQVVFWMHALTDDEMTLLKDGIGSLTSWGVKRLYKQPVDATTGERYCEARINSVEYSDNVRDMPHLRQRVTLNFQVANPSWYARGTETPSWGDGTLWAGGEAWGGAATPQAVAGIVTDFTINVAGNATTYPRIRIITGPSQTADSVMIQRLVNGVIVDEVIYETLLGNNSNLIINCRSLSVRLNGSDGYNSYFDYQQAGWFRLEPGVNNIRVLMVNGGGAASVYFHYFEAYK